MIKELRYYNKEYVYDLDQGTKSFIDLYGIRTIISYCDDLKKDLERLNDLTKSYFDIKNNNIKNLLDKKGVILNEIKNNIVKKNLFKFMNV